MSLHTPPARILLARAAAATRKGDLATAAQAFQDVLVRFPANRRAQDGLAALVRPDPKARHLTQNDLETTARLIAQGEYPAALVLAGSLLRLDGDNPALHEMIAVCHRKQGAPEKAVAAYDRALGALDTAGLWAGKGAALIEMQRPGKAAAALRRAAALQPGQAQHLTLIAQCERQMGQPSRALSTVRGALTLAPGDREALIEEGRILAALNRTDEAAAQLKAALTGGPRDAAALNELGMLARATGDSAAATAHYESALRLRPDAAAIHRNLSLVKTYGADDPQIGQMRDLLERDNIGDDARSHLHFALFNALDQLDDRPAAFEHLTQANRLRHAVLGYDLRKDARLFAALGRLTYGQVGAGKAGPTPVFIVGLPRSGTTLAEALLSQEAEAVATGELPVVANACMPLLRTMISEGRDHVTGIELGALQTTLRAGLADYAQGAPALIDKMPLDFRFLGLIAAALPEARFIHVVRDPMAVGWSLYRTCFGPGGNGFAYDIDDIAGFQALSARLMGHWRARLGARLIRLDYGALVQAPDAETGHLMAACGLPARTSPLPARAIRTASADAVRGAVTTGRDSGWRRYEKMLEPMRVALATDGG